MGINNAAPIELNGQEIIIGRQMLNFLLGLLNIKRFF